jgi:glycine oxidase
MADKAEVVIIGGGAAGCAAAYYLAKAGVKTAIIEREGIGSQASGYSAGGLNPLQGAGIPGPLGPLAIESFRMHLRMWDQLMSESGVDFQLQMISMVRVAFDESDLPELSETLNIFKAADADGFSARWIDSGDLHDLEPRLAPDAIKGLYTYGNAALNSCQYTVALSKASERLGARVHIGVVKGLKKSGGRVAGLLLQNGEIDCGTVVIASGPWAVEAGHWLGVSVPIEPLKGEILRMELPGPSLAHDFSSGGVSLFHRKDGLVWVGATEENCGFDARPSESARRYLLERAARLMPAMAEARIVRHTACLRPVTPDWLPIIGRAPGWENVYLATGAGRKGILLGPGMGKAIADLITEGSTRLPISPFAPERFAGTTSLGR